VIVILTSNETQNLTTPTTFHSIVFNDVNNFVKENSYNQAQLGGNVVGWYKVNNSNNPTKPQLGCASAAIPAADPFVNFLNYDTIITVGPCTNTVPSASLGPTLINTNEGVIYARLIQLPADFIFNFATTAIVAHELGHGFGVDHANAYKNCNPPFHIGGRSNCQFFNYGDPFDTMGGSFYSTNSSPHYSAEHKRQIGWTKDPLLAKKNIAFYIKPLENFSDQIAYNLTYAAELLATYSLEYRIPLGFDGNKDPTWPSVGEGVYIHFHYYNPPIYSNKSNFTYPASYGHILVDAHPETATLNDSFLKAGENYTDYLNNITFFIINTSLNGSNILISG
jgi:hypothetical protein